MTRDEFRNGVFARDNYKCVICGEEGKDAHHIIERRLWSDGGYYLDNGSTLCSKHHLEAEETLLSCETIREKCKISKVILPEHMYKDQLYDKWGNIILSNGQRLKGELFYDESVQKILEKGKVLHLFCKYVKYPRTYHLGHSNLGKDDRMMDDQDCFGGKKVVCTLKMDGENTTFYNDHLHARSIDSGNHPTRDRIKTLWSQIRYELDDRMRICGENLYAVHSIKYNDLKSYFYGFSIWIDDLCLDWKSTQEYFKILNIDSVPVFWEGIYDSKEIFNKFNESYSEHEGYVVRLIDSFKYASFRSSVGKYVKPEFRTLLNASHGNWFRKSIQTNELK